MTDREATIAAFLDRAGWRSAEREAIAGDASTRRYWRLRRQGRRTKRASAVLMEARPDASLTAFVKIAGLLDRQGLSVPKILAQETGHGLLLLEDFGDDRFDRLLDAGTAPEALFDLAVDGLIALHRGFEAGSAFADDLPDYDAATFLAQVLLFTDICLPLAYTGPELSEAQTSYREAWAATLPAAYAVPRSLLLRDYHVGNLIRLAGRDGVGACGIIDFQDAGIGPVTYDLVSLIEDARRDLSNALQERALARYLAARPQTDPRAFRASCAVLAVMRHFRVVAVFSRLAADAGRPEYLVHLPRLWRMIDRHLAAPALAPVSDWCQRWLTPSLRDEICSQ